MTSLIFHLSMGYIEPCCCDKQLPALLRERRTAFFQTNGDVTVQKFMGAVGRMAGQPSELWLMMPQVNLALLRTLRQWFQRGWINSLHLLTQENQETMVMGELGEAALASARPLGRFAPQRTPAEGTAGAVDYAHDPLVLDGLMAFIGTTDVVAIQGAMLTQVDFSLSLYAAAFGPRPKYFDAPDGKVRMMLEPVISKMRIKRAQTSRT